MDSSVLISVCTVTYNHEKFIAQAIDSVIAQKGNFRLEMIIGEDCSTDRTREIVKAYQEKYPDIVKPIYHEVNVGSKRNSVATLNSCTGQYIAALEGDDYWIDPYKLQKQLTLLQANSEMTLCFTEAEVRGEGGEITDSPYPVHHKSIYRIDDVILSPICIMPTASLFFRNVIKPLPDYYANALSGDIALQLLLADKGTIGRISDTTVVYRHHTGGITKSEASIKQGHQKLFELFEEFNAHTHHKYDELIKTRLQRMVEDEIANYILKPANKFRLVNVYNLFSKLAKYTHTGKLANIARFLTIVYFPAGLKLGVKLKRALS